MLFDIHSELASISPVFNVMEVIFLLWALSNRSFFKFQSVRRDIALLLINFMDKNAFSHVNVISKRNITLSKFS